MLPFHRHWDTSVQPSLGCLGPTLTRVRAKRRSSLGGLSHKPPWRGLHKAPVSAEPARRRLGVRALWVVAKETVTGIDECKVRPFKGETPHYGNARTIVGVYRRTARVQW